MISERKRTILYWSYFIQLIVVGWMLFCLFVQMRLHHFRVHGACLGSHAFLVFRAILTIASVSFGLGGILDVGIVEQVLKLRNFD